MSMTDQCATMNDRVKFVAYAPRMQMCKALERPLKYPDGVREYAPQYVSEALKMPPENGITNFEVEAAAPFSDRSIDSTF